MVVLCDLGGWWERIKVETLNKSCALKPRRSPLPSRAWTEAPYRYRRAESAVCAPRRAPAVVDGVICCRVATSCRVALPRRPAGRRYSD